MTTLIKKIRDAVRKEAQGIRTFYGRGCIRITAVPYNELADEFLGGMSDFSGNTPDIATYEYVFPIVPGEYIPSEFSDGNGGKKRVSTYGYSALKTAVCQLAYKEGGDFSTPWIKGDDLTEENGWAKCLGALCIDVEGMMQIYICVSGAKQTEDLLCARAGENIVKEFFEGYPFTIRVPSE